MNNEILVTKKIKININLRPCLLTKIERIFNTEEYEPF